MIKIKLWDCTKSQEDDLNILKSIIHYEFQNNWKNVINVTFMDKRTEISRNKFYEGFPELKSSFILRIFSFPNNDKKK